MLRLIVLPCLLFCTKLTHIRANKLLKMSANFLKIDNFFAIDGAINDDALAAISGDYKSILYLCKDTATDSGCVSSFIYFK